MGNYLVNFSLYTLAMVGIIFCALFVFKFVMSGNAFSKKSAFVKILDVLKLSPRKTLYVIKAGSEKFLIAADSDRTTLISKLAETASDKALKDIVTEIDNNDSKFENDDLSKTAFSQKDIFNKPRKYDFLSRPTKIRPKLKQEKCEGLNSLYGDDSIEEEFASVLNLKKDKNQKGPMMKEIARKLNF